MGDTVIISNINEVPLFAVLNESKLRFIDIETASSSLIGNIFVGRISNRVQNLDAAFVEYQKGIQGYLPLNSSYNFNNGQQLPVQIKVAPLKTKNAKLTNELSLNGIYCVITNEANGLFFSKKIDKDLSSKLRNILLPFCNSNYTYIIRSNVLSLSENEVDYIINDIRNLTEKLGLILKKSTSRSVFSNIFDGNDFVERNISKLNFSKIDAIVTDQINIYESLKSMLPVSISDKMRLYQDSAIVSLINVYELKAKIHNMISKTYWLKSGGYLIIEQTEAATIIDVNSGKNIKKMKKETLSKITNEEAAHEIPYILSTCNYSGIIIVDFINTDSSSDMQQIVEILNEEFMNDYVATNFIDITKLGLIEITRQKKDVLFTNKLKEANLYETFKN